MFGCFFIACDKPFSEPSFYFWRTKANFSTKEKEALASLHIKTLYVRFFDVDVSKVNGKPEPLGVIDSLVAIPQGTSIIPVVFITNRTFLDLPGTEIISLAKQIFLKINAIHKNYSELQIDCDWSEKTKENYFLFLEEIKKLISGKAILSCTIRLHQVKYPIRNGVPNVNRGMLMFYNMGNLSDIKGENSIYDPGNAKNYTSYIKNYNLPLDVALPIFKWFIHYRNNKVVGLITKKQMPDMNDTAHFSPTENNIIFNLKRDYLNKGVFYKQNDLLKLEVLSDEQLLDAAKILNLHLKEESRRVALYDLDELNINNYESKTIEKVFTVFN